MSPAPAALPATARPVSSILAMRRSDGTRILRAVEEPDVSDSEPSDDEAGTSYASIARRNALRRTSVTSVGVFAASSSAARPATSISAAAAHQSAALSLAISRSLNLESEIADETTALRRQTGDGALEHEASRRALNDAHRQLRAAERTIALLQSQIRIAQAGHEADSLASTALAPLAPSSATRSNSTLSTADRITLLVAEIARWVRVPQEAVADRASVRARLRPLETQAAAQAAAIEAHNAAAGSPALPPSDEDALATGLVDADGDPIPRPGPEKLAQLTRPPLRDAPDR